MCRNVLVVVDMQNDFIDGSLGTKEAQAILPAALARIKECRKAGYHIIATQDTHGDDYMNTREGKRLPVPHCIRGTNGWKFAPVLQDELSDAWIVEKHAFGSSKLPDIVNKVTDGEPEIIELIGLCTDICVVNNAMVLKAAFPEVQMQIRASCCAGVTPELHQAALDTMASCQIDIL